MARMQDAEYRLSERLAMLPLPPEGGKVADADGLLIALVNGCDSRGRYYAQPYLLHRLFWWQTTPSERVKSWRDDLVDRGDVAIELLARNIYSGTLFPVLSILNRRRFRRFSDRDYIPKSVRAAVYERDGWRCLHCGTGAELSLDHIIPWSHGGPDTDENLQTLCRPCNSSKGARVR